MILSWTVDIPLAILDSVPMILQWTDLSRILHIPLVHPSFRRDIFGTFNVCSIRSGDLSFIRMSAR